MVQQTEIAEHSIAIAPFEDLSQLSNTSPGATAVLNAFTDILKAKKASISDCSRGCQWMVTRGGLNTGNRSEQHPELGLS